MAVMVTRSWTPSTTGAVGRRWSSFVAFERTGV
jgi:hypothetical protein